MFYNFHQNNSGGSFEYNEERGISVFVIVEADSANEAIARAETIGVYFDGCDTGMDCPCCGDRWSTPYEDGDVRPTVYGSEVIDGLILKGKYGMKWMKGFEGFIHYKNGAVEGFDYER